MVYNKEAKNYLCVIYMSDFKDGIKNMILGERTNYLYNTIYWHARCKLITYLVVIFFIKTFGLFTEFKKNYFYLIHVLGIRFANSITLINHELVMSHSRFNIEVWQNSKKTLCTDFDYHSIVSRLIKTPKFWQTFDHFMINWNRVSNKISTATQLIENWGFSK